MLHAVKIINKLFTAGCKINCTCLQIAFILATQRMQNKKPSVVQITDQLNAGGAERVLVTLSNLLYKHGHAVTVITTVTKGPLATQLHPEIPVIDLERKSKWNPITMFRLVKIIKAFDIIHVHASYNLRYVYLAMKLFGLRKSIFFQEHYGNIATIKKPALHQRLIYPKTILIAVSGTIQQWALDVLKMDSSRVFLLPNIVAAYKNPSLKEPYKKGAVSLLLVSNILPAKHIEFAIELLHKLNTANNFHLTLIGKKADTIYFQRLQQKIKELQLLQCIHFIFDCNEIQPLLHQFDLALHSSKSESGPLVLIEYMAQGLPFVTFNTGEVVRQIKSELPELIADDFNTATWMEKIGYLLDDKNRLSVRNKMTSIFDAYYSEEEYYQRCLNIYEKGLKL